MPATDLQPALPMRSHTILGVCEGIGEDFGFNPMFLRVPLAATVLFSTTLAVGVYFALGLIVLASRLIFPRPKMVPVDAAATPVAAPAIAEEQYKLAA